MQSNASKRILSHGARNLISMLRKLNNAGKTYNYQSTNNANANTSIISVATATSNSENGSVTIQFMDGAYAPQDELPAWVVVLDEFGAVEQIEQAGEETGASDNE